MTDRTYEILFIADPNIGEADVDALTTTVSGFVEKEGGRIQKVEKWGKKRLSYLIKKHREGSYVLVVAEGPAKMVHEVERRIRVIDGIIKFITVRVDEELRRAESRKSRRASDEAKKKNRTASRTPGADAPAAAPAVTGTEGVQA